MLGKMVSSKHRYWNKPEPAQVGAINKAQKKQKNFQVSIYSTRKSKNGPKSQKKWAEWRAGPASASSWRAKWGTLPKFSTFLSQLKGGPFGENTNFRKKSLTMPKNWKGNLLGFFNIHSVAKHQKIEVGNIFIFGKKSHSAEKNWKGGPFGIFQHPFWPKMNQDIIEFGNILEFKNWIVWRKCFSAK